MLRLRTFGTLELTAGERALGAAAMQPRRLALLAALAVAGSQGMTRDALLGLFWPETTDARGRQSLSQALYALRRDTGVADLVLGAEHLRLNQDVVSSDVAELLAAAAAGDHRRVADAYAGPFLCGVHVSDGDAFERWAELQRLRFAQFAESSLEALALAADAAGDHEAAVAWWRRLSALDALKTRVAVRLISALAARGDRAEALRYADQYVKLVREDLGAEPNADVTALADRLRTDTAPARFDGRFVIERELGRGAMGVVYLARDVKHDRAVALKMLQSTISEAVGRERLEREILLTARLQHPHILPLFDSGESGGMLYYVMPYVAGESLRARLHRESTLPVADALSIACEVADALGHAHARGVIHRDVKPENILLAEGHAIVADFGIARTVAGAVGEALTDVGLAIGTPAYMSPEQVAGERDLDGRSDVFSLACVLYEMLAGRPPWIATTTQALLARRFVEEPVPLGVLRPDVPRVVADAVHRALDLDPSRRFDTAAAFGAALVAPETGRGTLPAPAVDLVGREHAIAAATGLLRRPDVRLVTFLGAGGSGKTQLVLHVARAAAAHFDDITFVDLSPLNEAALVIPAIALAYGVREVPGRSTVDAVAVHLAPRSSLLVLDNFEHVIGAAAEVSHLLAACPRVTVAVTSRVRLRIRGEHEFFVSPLELPTLEEIDGAAGDDLRRIPAVELFLRRALEIRPDVTIDAPALRTIAEICVRLDGLPLAIELAAARTRLLSLSAILARLDHSLELLTTGARDVPERHRSLRRAIAGSDELLASDERTAWRRLSVFAGGSSLDAAAAVIGAPEADTLDILESLVDASLLRIGSNATGEARITMLETVREYALEQLVAAGDEGVARERHREYFLRLAERLASDLTGDAQARALAQLDLDRDNFRSALEHAERTEPAKLLRLVLALWRYWLVRGQWTFGREWTGRATELAENAAPPEDLADAFHAAGTLAQNQGDYRTAFDAQERALSLWRRLGARDGEARTLTSMGWLAWRQCRYGDGRQLSEEALRLYRACGDEGGAAQALNNLGWIALFEGDYREAERRLREALEVRRRLGDRRNIAFALAATGWAVARQGDLHRAALLVDEALGLFREIGERQLYAFTTRVAAELALEEGRTADAQGMLTTTAIPIFRTIGDRWGLTVALGVLADGFVLDRRLEEAAAANDEALEIATALEDRYGIASTLARSVVLAEAAGDSERAAALSATVDGLLRETGGALGPLQSRMYGSAIARLRDTIGEERFAELVAAAGDRLSVIVG